MSRHELVIEGSTYTVEISGHTGDGATVNVNGVDYQVTLPTGGVPGTLPRAVPSGPPASPPATKAPPAAPAAAAKAPEGGEVVAAPMPGHILAVHVGAGQAVEVGDTLVVMEAMKMENEIRSHVAGTVSEVRVAKGQDVGVGEILVTIGV